MDMNFKLGRDRDLAMKNSITVLNTPGTIDADYRGEIKVLIIILVNKDFEYTIMV